jgi:hypothetical protein
MFRQSAMLRKGHSSPLTTAPLETSGHPVIHGIDTSLWKLIIPNRRNAIPLRSDAERVSCQCEENVTALLAAPAGGLPGVGALGVLDVEGSLDAAGSEALPAELAVHTMEAQREAAAA